MIGRNSNRKSKKISKVWARISETPKSVRNFPGTKVVAEIVPPREAQYRSVLDPHGTGEGTAAESPCKTMGETLASK